MYPGKLGCSDIAWEAFREKESLSAGCRSGYVSHPQNVQKGLYNYELEGPQNLLKHLKPENLSHSKALNQLKQLKFI